MPGIQATERVEKTIPIQPGQPARIEYEYKRHGTLCKIGNWNVVTGQLLTTTIAKIRTEEDFLRHLHNLVETDRSHRSRFVYTPKHSSWLNQIEIVFGIIGRRAES